MKKLLVLIFFMALLTMSAQSANKQVLSPDVGISQASIDIMPVTISCDFAIVSKCEMISIPEYCIVQPVKTQTYKTVIQDVWRNPEYGGINRLEYKSNHPLNYNIDHSYGLRY